MGRVTSTDPSGALRELSLPPTSFVFVVSDFLAPPDEEAWAEASARGFDLVPVVVQDPVWEQSFPAVGGCVLPLADPLTGSVRPVRLTRGEALDRARANEERLERLGECFWALGIEHVTLASSDPAHVLDRFLVWADGRRSGWPR